MTASTRYLEAAKAEEVARQLRSGMTAPSAHQPYKARSDSVEGWRLILTGS
jgi:hypothetical protein